MGNTLSSDAQLKIFWKVFSIHPELKSTAEVILLLSEVKYPINDFNELAKLYEEAGGSVAFNSEKITPKIASQFFSKEQFPIASEDALITHVFLAFSRGTNSHRLHAEKTTVIPNA